MQYDTICSIIQLELNREVFNRSLVPINGTIFRRISVPLCDKGPGNGSSSVSVNMSILISYILPMIYHTTRVNI